MGCAAELYFHPPVSDYLHDAPEATHESQAWLQEQGGEQKGTITIFISVLLE